MNSSTIGDVAEEQAYQYLLKQHYQLRSRNFRCKLGEIDLIMESPANEIIFIEVRYRKSNQFGGAIASVTTQKQRRIIQTAEYYLQKYHLTEKPCRFDVIAFNLKQQQVHLEWITDAFQV